MFMLTCHKIFVVIIHTTIANRDKSHLLAHGGIYNMSIPDLFTQFYNSTELHQT